LLPRPYFTCPVVKFIRKFLLLGYSKKGGKKSKIIKSITELKTNRSVLRELFEDIKQLEKLIKII